MFQLTTIATTVEDRALSVGMIFDGAGSTASRSM